MHKTEAPNCYVITEKLKFQKGNAKLSSYIYTFSLPAGWTCPGASLCKSKVIVKDNKRSVKDGPDCEFRCFAASQEALYKNTYNARQHNFRLLREAKTVDNMAELITASLPKKAGYVRVHVSGDFYSQDYLNAWIKVAKDNPTRIFYAYTKSIPFVIVSRHKIPSNFSIIASIGGRYDSQIAASGLYSARVVLSEAEAENLGLPIDHDDKHAICPTTNFALLVHGTQPKGSEAAKALVQLKKAGKGGYSAKRKK